MTAPKVALLGPYASRNLGDTATQLSAVANLRARRADIRLVGISPDPADTTRSVGIAAFPLDGLGPSSGLPPGEPGAVPETDSGRRRPPMQALRRQYEFARSLDLLVISGGGQLDDFWGGAWSHPWSILRWTVLARRHGVPVAFVGVGMDRLSTWSAQRMTLAALALASYRSFRDSGTERSLRDLGLAKASVVCPDLAFGLPTGRAAATAPGERFAVINPVSGRTWSKETADVRHAAYLESLVDAGAWLAGRGLKLRIACSQIAMDPGDAFELARMLAARDVRDVSVCRIERVDDYLAEVRGAEIVVASRLHGAILAFVAGSPVVALAPLPKLRQLMEDVGMEHACLDLQDVAAPALIACLGSSLARTAELRRLIEETNRRLRSQLARTFDDVDALLGDTGRSAAQAGDTAAAGQG